MPKPRRRFPPLYWPYKSWKQAALGYAIGFVLLAAVQTLRFLVDKVTQ